MRLGKSMGKYYLVGLAAIALVFLASPVFAQVSCIPTFTPGCVLTLSWVDNSSNELGFHIWRKLNTASYPLTPSATVAPGVTTFVDSGMVQGSVVNKYDYVVSAFNTSAPVPPATTGVNQESGFTNEVSYSVPALVVPIPPPAAPSGAVLK